MSDSKPVSAGEKTMDMIEAPNTDWLDSEAAFDVMSMMCFQLGPIAHLFQKLGEPIKQRAEDEQAFAMRWLLKKVKEHGDGWRESAGADIRIMIDKVKALEAEKLENR